MGPLNWTSTGEGRNRADVAEWHCYTFCVWRGAMDRGLMFSIRADDGTHIMQREGWATRDEAHDEIDKVRRYLKTPAPPVSYCPSCAASHHWPGDH